MPLAITIIGLLLILLAAAKIQYLFTQVGIPIRINDSVLNLPLQIVLSIAAFTEFTVGLSLVLYPRAVYSHLALLYLGLTLAIYRSLHVLIDGGVQCPCLGKIPVLLGIGATTTNRISAAVLVLLLATSVTALFYRRKRLSQRECGAD